MRPTNTSTLNSLFRAVFPPVSKYRLKGLAQYFNKFVPGAWSLRWELSHKHKTNTMQIEKLFPSGDLLISDIVKGQYQKLRLSGYNKREALRIFKKTYPKK